MRVFAIGALVAPALLAGCVYTAVSSTPTVTSGDGTSPVAAICRAAIAERLGAPVEQVKILDVKRALAGTEVRAGVPSARAPWACNADNQGRILSVIYTG